MIALHGAELAVGDGPHAAAARGARGGLRRGVTGRTPRLREALLHEHARPSGGRGPRASRRARPGGRASPASAIARRLDLGLVGEVLREQRDELRLDGGLGYGRARRRPSRPGVSPASPRRVRSARAKCACRVLSRPPPGWQAAVCSWPASSGIPKRVAGGAAIVRPRRVRAGDVVGVVAPAGPIEEPNLRAGLAVLESFGLRPRLGAAVLERRGISRRRRRRPSRRPRGDARRSRASAPSSARAAATAASASSRRSIGRRCATIRSRSSATATSPPLHGAPSPRGRGELPRPDGRERHGARSHRDARSISLWSGLSDPERAPRRAGADASIRGGRARGRLAGGCLSVSRDHARHARGPSTRRTRSSFLEDVRRMAVSARSPAAAAPSGRRVRPRRRRRRLRDAGDVPERAGCRGRLDAVRDAFADAPFPGRLHGLPAGTSRPKRPTWRT